MLSPMDDFRAVNGVYAASDALGTVGMVYNRGRFRNQKGDPG